MLNRIQYKKIKNRYCVQRFHFTRMQKNTMSGRTALVIGNGPSALKINPQRVAELRAEGLDVWVTNSYFSSTLSESLRGDYLVLTDPRWFDESLSEMYPIQRQEILDSWKHIRKYRPKLLVPEYCKVDISGVDAFYMSAKTPLLRRNYSDITKPLSVRPLTGTKAIIAAQYFGYSKIWICGIDNSRFLTLRVDRENSVFQESCHFFDQQLSASGRSEGRTMKLSKTIGQQLFEVADAFRDFHRINTGSIYNLDVNSLIDAFPKNDDLGILEKEVIL